MRRRVAAFLATALLMGLLALPTASAGAAAYCSGRAALDVTAMPEEIALADCDIVGRTLKYGGLEAKVPPPGRGFSLRALRTTGEVKLEVVTTQAGVVTIAAATEVVAEPPAAVTPRRPADFAAAAAAANDSFAAARTLVVPSSHMSAQDSTILATDATLEAGESTTGCMSDATGSLWYRIERPGTLSRIKLAADAPMALHRGTTLSNLSRVACLPAADRAQVSRSQRVVTLQPAGTYYLQLGLGVPGSPPGFIVSMSNAEQQPAGPPPCDVKPYTHIGLGSLGKFRWRYNDADGPQNLTFRQTLRAVKKGINVITGSRNDCGMADRVNARAEYLGKTKKRANACQGDPDGLSVVAFGTTPPNTLGIACYGYYTDTRYGAEYDIKLSTATAWTNQPDSPTCTGQTDLVGVMAHEAGHVFGLDHAWGEKGLNQTMAPSTPPCNGAGRTLGRGDVIGLRKLY